MLKISSAFIIFGLSLINAITVLAQPTIGEILELSKSIVLVSTDIGNGKTGRGSGVVISAEYVATNCHVIANAKGANVAKHQVAYTPIGIKADWKHDLCLLKFQDLPIQAVEMRDSANLNYEEETISLGYPSGNNVPQPSYGNIKALHPLDDGVIIRTSSAFSLGSSGGALFDSNFHLIGITTFKSPGAKGYYYNLPTEWIKNLINKSPDLTDLSTQEVPFWALPLSERPYFMQVVIPYQNQEWTNLQIISQQWTKSEPTSPDAWYFLGLAAEGLGEMVRAKQYFNQAYQLNTRDLDAMLALSRVAFAEKDIATLETLTEKVRLIDAAEADQLTKMIVQLKS
jgi:serine protease Do